MSVLDQIKAPVKSEMEGFESEFRASMKSRVALLDKIMHYIIKRKGKQMRPLFVFLTSKMNGQITESTYTAASLIELLHTATLVHDDVVEVGAVRDAGPEVVLLVRSLGGHNRNVKDDVFNVSIRVFLHAACAR